MSASTLCIIGQHCETRQTFTSWFRLPNHHRRLLRHSQNRRPETETRFLVAARCPHRYNKLTSTESSSIEGKDGTLPFPHDTRDILSAIGICLGESCSAGPEASGSPGRLPSPISATGGSFGASAPEDIADQELRDEAIHLGVGCTMCERPCNLT